jgi:hypothetical protein
MFEATQEIEELRQLRGKYLNSWGDEKAAIERDFRKIQSDMFQHSINWGGRETETLKLSQWNPFSNESCPWFDPGWMFGLDNGFHIVIGNPPWGQKSVKFSTEDRRYYKAVYPAAMVGQLDIFRLFVEKAIMITAKEGSFANVLPDIVLLKNYGSTRKHILDSLIITSIDHWGMAFENVNLDCCTIIGQRGQFDTEHVIRTSVHSENTVHRNKLPQSLFLKTDDYKFNLFINEQSLSLLDKVRTPGCFGDHFEPHEGIHSGNIRSKLFIEEKKDDHCRRLILGRDEVRRYSLTWRGKWVHYDHGIVDKTKGEYAGLGRTEYFERDKIVVRRTGDFILAALDMDKYYFSNNVFVCVPKEESSLDMRYVLGLLNSKLATWFYRTIQPRKGKLFAELKINVLKQIPIKDSPTSEQDKIIQLVEKILERKMSNPDVDITAIEKDIDEAVYHIFNLTEQERILIENGG